MDEKSASEPKEKENTTCNSECSICLQPLIQPVKLPCNHIFCYLCAKGIIQQSNKCALCRKNIPKNYLSNPQFVQRETETSDNSYRWFYKGQSGWWQYDDRTNSEIETAYQNDESQCEVLIAGNLYIIDFTANSQMQKVNPMCRRRIKRDLASVSKKGVAGVHLISDSANCKQSCSKNSDADDDSCKSAAPTKLKSNTDFVIVFPQNGVSGVCLNFDNRGLSVCANSKASSSSDNSCPGKSIGVQATPIPEKHCNPEIEELTNASSEESSSSGSSRSTTVLDNLTTDDDSSSWPKERKRRKVTDILDFTEQDILKSYVTTVISKLQEMSIEQRLFSEKRINDTLFEGLLGKLSENSSFPEKEQRKTTDDDSSSWPTGRKRRKVTDILEFTEQDILKSYAATVTFKLQEMNKEQRLFSEKLINDTLFKGLLGKLSEHSCVVKAP